MTHTTYKVVEEWAAPTYYEYGTGKELYDEDEFKPKDGEIETEEFKYLIGERVA